MLVMVI